MKYAIWNLAVEPDGYLSGPETAIKEAGGSAEASWANGPVESATILGYVTGDFILDLSKWNYQEIAQSDALIFCQTINETAHITENGKILAIES